MLQCWDMAAVQTPQLLAGSMRAYSRLPSASLCVPSLCTAPSQTASCSVLRCRAHFVPLDAGVIECGPGLCFPADPSRRVLCRPEVLQRQEGLLCEQPAITVSTTAGTSACMSSQPSGSHRIWDLCVYPAGQGCRSRE